MTDPVSILKFILFVTNIREYAREVARSFDQVTPAVVKSIEDLSILQWRADNACNLFEEECFTLDELVSRWRSSMDDSNMEM